jgi:anionic cell wall polymer biosynthesis LytR-Cps2A-Psr (LCP) family protein
MPNIPDLPWGKLFGFGAAILFAILLIFIGMKAASWYEKIKIDGPKTGKNETKPPVEKTEYTILLAGYGGPGHDGAYLTDTLMVAHIDKKTKKVVLFNVPRDLWVKVPSKDPKSNTHSKINALYQMALFPEDYPNIPKEYQGKDNAPTFLKKVITEVTGFEVDYFVGIDFGGFRQLIDTLGGVDVNVRTTFTDYEYPIDGHEDDPCGKKDTELEDAVKQATEEPVLAFPCRYETLHFDQGPIHLDGETALKYARSRHSLQDGSDFGRAARQQQVIEAVKDKVFSITFIPKILPLIDTLSNNIRTDISASEMDNFIGQAASANDYKITNYVMSTDEVLMNDVSADGQYILVSKDGLDKWNIVKKVFHNVVEGISPSPTPSVTPRVSPTPKVTKKPAANKAI